jgi:hypothetical protein
MNNGEPQGPLRETLRGHEQSPICRSALEIASYLAMMVGYKIYLSCEVPKQVRHDAVFVICRPIRVSRRGL